MCVRMAVLAGVANPGVLVPLVPVLAVMTVVGGLGAWLLARTDGHAAAHTESVANPFSLRAALAFAALYAVVLVGVRAAGSLGTGGLYLASALAAVVGVDAPTVALARLDPGAGGWAAPAAAIAVVAVTNTLVKLVIALAYGAGTFRFRVSTTLGVMSLLGLAAGVGILAQF
jgi:uncharacterized membrane protein (DUF4010 family)